MRYTIRENYSVLSEGFPEIARVLRDEEAGPAEIQKYFDKSFDIFTARLEDFRAARNLSEKEEKELRFMLEALIAAKHILDQE